MHGQVFYQRMPTGQERVWELMTRPQFEKVVIFGVGLIGGSFALALRRANAVREVVGFGRSVETLKQAQQLGIIDRKSVV